MKRSRRTKQNQLELFCQPDLAADLMLPELPAERQIELERVLADLLLDAAVGKPRIGGGVHDDV
jgi:hypothetical protein